MNYIFYNDKQIPFPTPLVSLAQDNISYNKDWAKNITVNLEGQLTGDYQNIRRSQSGLLNIFDKNFKNFDIYETTGSYRVVLSGTSNGNLRLTGELPINGKSLILEIDGCYSSSTPATWEISNNLIDWRPFYLYKIKYYTTSCCNCGPSLRSQFGNAAIFSQASLVNQPLPYTGTTGVTHISDLTSDLTKNALGVYSGEYTYSSGKYIRLRGTYIGGSTIGMKLETSGDLAENIYSRRGIIIRSINFEESPYFGIVNYNIELNAIESSGNVLDPKNEFSFVEDDQKNLRLTHNISARGLNTSSSNKSNALQNAINFVRSYTGLNNVPSVRFISGFNNKFYLQSISESVNRLNAVYSIQEDYTANLLNTGASGSLNYTINVNSGAENNSIQVDIRGNYKGPLYGDINLLRGSLNVYNLITGSYSGYINPTPIQYTLTENTGENSIAFDYSFDSINLPNPYYKYDGTITRSELDQIINVQARGEVVSRGNLKYRSSIIDSNVEPLITGLDIFASGLVSGYRDMNNISSNIKLRRTNLSITKNKNDGTLNIETNYDDKYLPSGNFIDASYNINVSAPYWYMNNQPTCNIYGYHIINDFDITTLPKVSLGINASAPENSNSPENMFRDQILKISSGITPKNYNFSKTTSENYSITKKYDNLNTLYDISYNINKVSTDNQNGLLPKFDVII